MDIDKVHDLDLVPDDFEAGAHEKLDEDVRPILPSKLFPASAPHFLRCIVEQLGHRLHPKYHFINEYKTLLQNNPSIYDMLLACHSNGSYKNVRLLSKDLFAICCLHV